MPGEAIGRYGATANIQLLSRTFAANCWCCGTAEQRCGEKRYCVVPKSGIAVRRAAGAAERRETGCCGNCVGRVWCDRHVGAAVPRTARAAVPAEARRWSVLVPFPFDFSSRLRGCLDDRRQS